MQNKIKSKNYKKFPARGHSANQRISMRGISDRPNLAGFFVKGGGIMEKVRIFSDIKNRDEALIDAINDWLSFGPETELGPDVDLDAHEFIRQLQNHNSYHDYNGCDFYEYC